MNIDFKVCSEVYKQQGKPDRYCALNCYHVGCCQDETGFKFIVEHFPLFDMYWPDHMGNGPSGYPMNDEDFHREANQVLQKRQDDLRQAEDFLEALDHALRKRSQS